MRRLSEEQVARVALRAQAMSDPTRVRILDVLGRAEQSVGQVAAALRSDASLISRHLQVLFHARLVQRRRQANTVIYSVASSDLADWCRYLAAPALSPRDPSAS